MYYKGGSNLFKRTDIPIDEQVLQILALTTSIEVVTEQPLNNAVIYKLTFDKSIDKYLYGLQLNTPQTPIYVTPRSLIVKYAYDSIDDPDFNMEARVHFELASAKDIGNIFAIAPTFIFSEIIQRAFNEPFTPIGLTFAQLLVHFNLSQRLDTYLEKHLPEDRSHYKQTIIIMEMIDGYTLYHGLEVAEPFSHTNPMPKLPFTFNKSFVQNFYTFYLLTLLAEKGFSHGDPHSGNFMYARPNGIPFFKNRFGELLSQYGVNVVPYIIDFGRAAPLDKLIFEPFTQAQLSNEVFQRECAFYFKVYYTLVSLISSNTIETIVKNVILEQHEYVQAILILTMCGYKHKSMFQVANKTQSNLYNNFFKITREEANTLNILIHEAIGDRVLLEQQHIRHLTQLLTYQPQAFNPFGDWPHGRGNKKYNVKKTRIKNRDKLHKNKITKPKKAKTRKKTRI